MFIDPLAPRKPRKISRAFTYGPKIEPVWAGEIAHTIRILNLPSHHNCSMATIREKKANIGDEILYHTWTGTPYFSKWGKRMRITINFEKVIKIYKEGIVMTARPGGALERWEELDELAALDGIVPPTGEEIGHLFNRMHKLSGAFEVRQRNDYVKYFQRIGWDGNELRDVVNDGCKEEDTGADS